MLVGWSAPLQKPRAGRGSGAVLLLPLSLVPAAFHSGDADWTRVWSPPPLIRRGPQGGGAGHALLGPQVQWARTATHRQRAHAHTQVCTSMKRHVPGPLTDAGSCAHTHSHTHGTQQHPATPAQPPSSSENPTGAQARVLSRVHPAQAQTNTASGRECAWSRLSGQGGRGVGTRPLHPPWLSHVPASHPRPGTAPETRPGLWEAPPRVRAASPEDPAWPSHAPQPAPAGLEPSGASCKLRAAQSCLVHTVGANQSPVHSAHQCPPGSPP